MSMTRSSRCTKKWITNLFDCFSGESIIKNLHLAPSQCLQENKPLVPEWTQASSTGAGLGMGGKAVLPGLMGRAESFSLIYHLVSSGAGAPSGGLWLHGLTLRGPRWRLQGQGLVLGLCQRVDHGHVHIEVVSLLKPPATLVTGKVQLGLGLVFGHVVLEGCPLPALEPADFTLQRLGSRVPHLVDEEVLPLLEGLPTLVTNIVPHL